MNPHGLMTGTRTARLRNGFCPDCVPLVEAIRERFEWVEVLGKPAMAKVRYRCPQCKVTWGSPGHQFQSHV